MVGPQILLAQGIADYFERENLPIFGVKESAARLESSKIFSKRFMKKHGLPTADFEVFEDAQSAEKFVRAQFAKPDSYSVLKADGLAAGKGVVLAATLEQALEAIQKMMVEGTFAEAGRKILIEKKMQGPELSLLAFCDGKTLRPLPYARDYKRVFDGQTGPNTGGMGAICPVPVSAADQKAIEKTILQPFLQGIQAEGIDYRGIIYFGLMLTPQGPSVLEFNVRFGDPETQSLLPLLGADLAEIFLATVHKKLDQVVLAPPKESAVGLVCAAGGYPGTYENHKEISGLAQNARDPMQLAENVWAFHAGTVQENGRFYSNGGRVLNVVALGDNFAQARTRAYEAVGGIAFEGMHFRRDIGLEMVEAT